jgi:uncharacterized delta-60 repeat protein
MNASSVVLHTVLRNTIQLIRRSPYAILRWKSKLLFPVIVLFSLFAQISWASPGDLDSTFGGAFGRYFINQQPNEFDAASAVVRQPDGKLIIAGTCGSGASADFCVLRRNVDGSADTAFGYAQGASRITPSNFADDAVAVALQSNGKIVVAGSCVAFNVRSFCMARLESNGLLDASFGTGGIVNQIVGAGDANPRAMLIQPDGKIVMGGTCFDGTYDTLCAARFLPSGAFDLSFGVQGRRLVPTSTTIRGYALALQPDGKILLAGSSFSSTLMFVARFASNGDIDNSYGLAGYANPASADVPNSIARAVALQADGKALIAGYCDVGANATGFCIARFDANGAIDTTFGSNGIVKSSIGTAYAMATAIAIQNDGRIVVAGSCVVANYDFCLVRLNDDGRIDTSFGTNGVVKINVIDANDFVYAMLIQPDGKIVVAGQCSESSAPSDAAMCIARYEGGPFSARNCSLDIDGDGVVLGTTDQLILSRIARGLNTSAVVGGITFGPAATRRNWPDIRAQLVAQCGVSLP